MSERKEPTLQGAGADIDLSRPEPKAEPAPARAQESRAYAPAERAPSVAPRTPAPAVASKSGGSSGLTLFALVLALAGLVASTLLYTQLRQRTEEFKSSFAAADKRIVELESRLALSDNESNQSVSAIHEKLKWADSEIRKLWALANERNRKAIESNTARLDALSGTVKTVTASVDGMKTDGAAAKKQAEANAAQIKQMGLQISAAAEQASQAFDDSSATRKELQGMVTKLAAMDKSLQQLKVDLNNRVAVNEEAIRAIDAHRLKLNQDVQALQSRLNGVAK